MKKALFLFNILCLLFGFYGVAGAVVLDFEGLTNQRASSMSNYQGYGSFTWDAGWWLYNDAMFQTPSHSGYYAVINNYWANPIGLTSLNPFTFNGVWMTVWAGYDAMDVKIQSFDQNNHLIAETPFYTITPSGYSYLSADFTNIYKINFVGTTLGPQHTAFVIDDFTFNEPINTANPVPEPATMMLLGSGLLGIIGLQRRKQRLF